MAILMAVKNLYTICGRNYQLPYPKNEEAVVQEANNEANSVARSISATFQKAYVDFLKRSRKDSIDEYDQNDCEDEAYYKSVLNQQQSPAKELAQFCNEDAYLEVTVEKLAGEPVGIALAETGWGSVVPTVLVARLALHGAAQRNGNINVGAHIMAINGQSLVGLPLLTSRQHFKRCRKKSSVHLSLVDCAPVLDVMIRRPSVRYQMGFSVNNGVVFSLLRGGIAERGGLRVGHRIIELNGQSLVNLPHKTIVDNLCNSTGDIAMKTMPLSIFNIMIGQEKPYFV